MTGAYVSIFLEDGWAHQKYHGWSVLREEPGFKVLAKKHGPVRRRLVLSNGLAAEVLEENIRNAGLLDARTDVILHDFDDPGETERMICGCKWRRAQTDERLLNIATFVIDLSECEDGLWKNFGPKSRNAVRKAQASGVGFRVTAEPDADFDAFFDFYAPLAQRLGLQLPPRAEFERMLAGKNMLCTASYEASGEPTMVNLIYLAGPHGFYMHGASKSHVETGTGQFLQWEIIRLLKARGYRWYDLGGLPSTDSSDGIYKFKKSLGGKLISLGTEYIQRPILVRAALGLKARLSR